MQVTMNDGSSAKRSVQGASYNLDKTWNKIKNQLKPKTTPSGLPTAGGLGNALVSGTKKGGGGTAGKPPAPVPSSQGKANRGTTKDNSTEVKEVTRKIDYDLEGTLQIRPLVGIKARTTVKLENLGTNFSGVYFIDTVIHEISPTNGYTQSLNLFKDEFKWAEQEFTETRKPKVQPKTEKKKRTYTVKRGDTLWGIAKRFYGNGAQYPKIFNANRDKIKDPHWIYPGQVFVIP